MAQTWKLAMLDKDGLLTGYKRCAKKACKTGKTQVAVPEECALEPGRYRWDDTTFVPLPPKGGEGRLLDDPPALAAIALGFLALSEGRPLPRETTAWAKQHMESFDGRSWLGLLRGEKP